MDRYHVNHSVGFEDSLVNDPKKSQEIIKQDSRVMLEDFALQLSHEEVSGMSVYTGKMGIALLYLNLHCLGHGAHYLIKAQDILEQAMMSLRGKHASFLEGDAGPLALGVLISEQTGNSKLRKDALQKLLDLGNLVLDTDNGSMVNEVLYGRAGYLYSLLLVTKHIPGIIDDSFIAKVVRVLVEEGKRVGRPVLYYEWHAKCYLGAVHGISGIIYILLQARAWLSGDDIIWIQRTVDWLLSLLFPSGNLPSSLGSTDDRLVHFCHGAPGAIYAFIVAHQVYGDKKYLEAATGCGEEIWRRGLLKKGYSLCHGVSGNAYGLMALYQHTKDEKYLKRALIFAKWSYEHKNKAEHPPDRPLSLFEGQAGVVYMLSDFAFNPNPTFPAFQL